MQAFTRLGARLGLIFWLGALRVDFIVRRSDSEEVEMLSVALKAEFILAANANGFPLGGSEGATLYGLTQGEDADNPKAHEFCDSYMPDIRAWASSHPCFVKG